MHNIFDNEQLRAVLFDMDGVLFDSMPNHATAWTQAVASFGLYMTRKEVYMNEGRTGSGTINTLTQRSWGRYATEQEVEQIYKAKSAFFNQCPTAQPMPFAREVVEAVRARGLARVIVTGSGQLSLLERLNVAFSGAFCQELMVTAFDVKLGKPNPEPYLKGLAKAGQALNADHSPLLPSQAIVVENAPLGIQAAKAAGIFCVAVNTGPLEDEVLLDAGADIIFPSMCALADYLTHKDA
ncbi:MAG: HAD-IA family hydrolase [Bacteroidales bacterium]|nr:HAD-IA family hydrolase [Candidatus Physcousia equi]